MKKNAIIVLFGLASMNTYSADVAVPMETGTITVKGNAYSSACTLSTSSVNLTLPTTYAADYKSKGDSSPISEGSAIVTLQCPELIYTDVYTSVTGTPESSEPSLFKIPVGTGKATGVALKLFAQPSGSEEKMIELQPNKETLLKQYTVPKNLSFSWKAQIVAISDTVTPGDLATTLTWTTRYN